MTTSIGLRVKRIRRARAARDDGMPPPPHWRCSDCNAPCSCTEQRLAHVRCGLKKEIT